MGGGAPLSYLNKKQWHPGRLQNQEKVWLKEQEAASEQRKLEELKKERDEERAREELEALAQGAGVRKREEKLDWMYRGSVAASRKVEEEQEQKAKDEELRRERDEREKRARGQQRWLLQEDNTNSNNEIWQRLHGDPLMMMKQQEMQARRSIVSNPVKMDAVRRRVEDEKRRKEEKRREKKKEKKEKKEKKKERKHREGIAAEEGRSRKQQKRSIHDEECRDERDVQRTTQVHSDSRAEMNANYGLSHAAAAPDVIKSRTNISAIEANKKRLEDAARRHEEELHRDNDVRIARSGRHDARRRNKTNSKLTEEEKRRRLEEMTNNSSLMDAARRSRIAHHTETDAYEQQALLHRAKKE